MIDSLAPILTKAGYLTLFLAFVSGIYLFQRTHLRLGRYRKEIKTWLNYEASHTTPNQRNQWLQHFEREELLPAARLIAEYHCSPEDRGDLVVPALADFGDRIRDSFGNLSVIAPILGTMPTISGVMAFLGPWSASLAEPSSGPADISPLTDALFTTYLGLALAVLAFIAGRIASARMEAGLKKAFCHRSPDFNQNPQPIEAPSEPHES